MKKGKIAILLALSLGITSAIAGCGASSKASISAAVDQAGEDMQDEAAPEGSQAADQAGVGKIPEVAAANLTEEEAANPVPDQFHVELEEVSRVRGKYDYRVNDYSLQHLEGDSCTFCDFRGNPVDPRPVYNIEYLGWDLFSVTLKSEDDINCTGLVDTAGNVLIPFEAAVIDFPSRHPVAERPRYILVCKGTEVTTNQDESLFSAWKYMFAGITGDEAVYYKGTLRIFDLETGQYVNGLEFTDGFRYSIAQVADNIWADVGDKAVVYSPDGKEIYTEQGNLTCNYRYMTDYSDGQYFIMDSNGVRLYTSETYLREINYKSQYFLIAENGKYGAVDCRGETLLPIEYDYFAGETKDRFCVHHGEGIYSLIARDGSVIATGSYMTDADPLGFQTFGEYGNNSLVTPGNRIFEGLDSTSRFLVFTKDDKAFYLVLNTGEFVPISDYTCWGVGKGVLALRNSERKYKLVDVFTGNDLSGFDYDEAWYINDDYLYVEEGDDIVIYKPIVVPEG